MRFFRHHIFSASMLAAVTCLASGSATAFLVPGLSDPLGAENSIKPYTSSGIRLKPDACPPIPADSKRVFSMGEVVAISLCNNPDTRAAYLSLLQSADTYVKSYSSYFPTITGTTSLNRSRSLSPASTTISRDAGVSASMTLFDFGQRELGVDAADQALMAAGYSYDSTLQGAIAAAINGYYKLLTAQNGVKVAEESEKFAQASYESAKLKHEIGQVALADELQAKGSYSQAMLATQTARNSLALARAALARLMGIAADEELQVEEMNDNMLTLEPFGGQLPQLLEKAKASRVDLLAKRANLEGAKIALSKTRRENLATVTASVDGGLDRPNGYSGSTTRSNSIGLSVSIPIFTGFTQTYNERSAKTVVKSSQEALLAAELGVEQDVWNAWHNYQTSKQSWDTSLELLDSSTLLKDVALGRYKEGVGTILDVLNAQSQYRSALQSQLNARYNLLTTRIDLVRAVGVLNLDTMKPEATLSLPAANAPSPQENTVPETPSTSAPAPAIPDETPRADTDAGAIPLALLLHRSGKPMLDDIAAIDNPPIEPVTP